MDDTPGQPGSTPVGTLTRTAIPRAITGWIRVGTIDPELAGLVSIMIERGLPLVVAAGGDGQAGGWPAADVRDEFGKALLACALAPSAGVRTPAPVTVDAGSLEAVLIRMPMLGVESPDDAGARVAIVMVLTVDAEDQAWRVSAAHLLRPSLRDGHGHLQRQGPAVLSTWDPALRRFEHFSWAVMAELAALVLERAGDLDAEVGARSSLLAGLRDHRIDDPGAVRLALEAARAAQGSTRRH